MDESIKEVSGQVLLTRDLNDFKDSFSENIIPFEVDEIVDSKETKAFGSIMTGTEMCGVKSLR